jgi:sugar-specific transcriptional regulator TrmB
MSNNFSPTESSEVIKALKERKEFVNKVKDELIMLANRGIENEELVKKIMSLVAKEPKNMEFFDLLFEINSNLTTDNKLVKETLCKLINEHSRHIVAILENFECLDAKIKNIEKSLVNNTQNEKLEEKQTEEYFLIFGNKINKKNTLVSIIVLIVLIFGMYASNPIAADKTINTLENITKNVNAKEK